MYAPSVVPLKRRRAVSELITLINPMIKLGCIDMLVTDGRIRFRCGVDLEGGVAGVGEAGGGGHVGGLLGWGWEEWGKWE